MSWNINEINFQQYIISSKRNNDDFLHCTCEGMPISVQKYLALMESQVSYLRKFQYYLSGFFLTRSSADTLL